MSSWFKRIFGGKPATRLASAARSYFKGAQVSRLLLDWIVAPLAADKEIRADLLKLRARARDLARNNPFIRQYLALITANVVGPHGVRMQAQVVNNNGQLAKQINDKLEAAWARWCKKATLDGRMSLTHAAQLAARTLATDGEVFVKLVREPDATGKYFFAIQLIDADLVDHEYTVPAGVGQNEIRLGVEIDGYGRPVAYHVWDRHQSDENQSARKRLRVPADQMLHIYDPDRVNQTRGVTWFNSVMVPLKMFDGYVEAELTAARAAAAKMGFIKYTDTAAMYLTDNAAPGESPIPDAPLQWDASPGTIEHLPPGTEFQPWDPAHPTTAYESYSKGVLRQVASGLRVSYNALANDLSDVNYSSFRSGLLIERDMWRLLQQFFIDRFYQPIYEAWLEVAILERDVILDSRDPSRFQTVRWIPRGWQWVDPAKDIAASVMAINNGLASRTDVLAETGSDFEEVLTNLVREQQMSEANGLMLGASAMQTAAIQQQNPPAAPDNTDPPTPEQ